MKKSMIYPIAIASMLASVLVSAHTLQFATEATYEPFVYMKENGQMTGFGADMVHALCQQMHQSCELVNAPWDSLLPSLEMGKYDGLFGGMGITQKRKQVVNFTSSYYDNGVVYVVKKQSEISPKHMSGAVIGVQGGTQFQAYLQGVYANQVTIKAYASNMTALMDLKQGRIDAVFIDQPVAMAWLKKNNNAVDFTTTGHVVNKAYFGDGNGIASTKITLSC